MSQPATTEAPRRRGRPRKQAAAPVAPSNPQLPGIVIAIDSKPRLRVGAICEIVRSSIPENIGARVEIIDFPNEYPGYASIRAIDRPLLATLFGTQERAGESWTCLIAPCNLYRVGHIEARRAA